MSSTIAMLVIGVLVSILGGYLYSKKEKANRNNSNVVSRFSLVASGYILSLGLLIIIVGIYLMTK